VHENDHSLVSSGQRRSRGGSFLCYGDAHVHELIRDHVTLSIRCLDRLSLDAYMPKLQTAGGLSYFLRDHLGHPIPSPALFAPMLERFVGAIKRDAISSGDVVMILESIRRDDVATRPCGHRPS
jgi:hypothetical protein